MSNPSTIYRGRIAPTPSGYLHTGHAKTFYTAWKRAREHGGTLILRNEDIDPQRCKAKFVEAMIEDLHWLGIDWDEGCDIGGVYAPYTQSQGRTFFLKAWEALRDGGYIYPCTRSRKDVREAAAAPHADNASAEPIFPPQWRPPIGTGKEATTPEGFNWRFRVPDGQTISFTDGRCGEQVFIAGKDFGDFLIWRRDDVPAYELAVVVDDARQGITEVVRGEDLLLSTARQILLYEALGLQAPDFYHCELVCDADGKRLAKRNDALSLRSLRENGASLDDLIKNMNR